VIGIDPRYFLDEMSLDEVAFIIKARRELDDKVNKQSWEQTREICYYAFIAMRGNERIKEPEDLFRFSWEKKEVKKSKRLTKEEAAEKAIRSRSKIKRIT